MTTKHMSIAIQGGHASFHDMATRQYFIGRPIELKTCRTFTELINSVEKNEVDAGVMAIENTLAGSILPNYTLLEASKLNVIGEIYMRIGQCIMALPGQTIENIEIVRSHPMALHQCSKYLQLYPHIRAVESFDTADSAREIREKNLKGVAAIAGKMAAGRYQLSLLGEEIENQKQNYTRFLILLNRSYENNEADKASLRFRTSHDVGSLSNALNVFKNHDINLSKIQSIPVVGEPQTYAFHLDVQWSNVSNFHSAIEAIQPFVSELKVLGIYKSGVIPYDHTVRQPAFPG